MSSYKRLSAKAKGLVYFKKMKAIILLALVAAASAAPKVADLWHPMDRINERDERIVGGSNVGALGQHPHQISLFNNGGFSCGGAIYTTNRCVTAGKRRHTKQKMAAHGSNIHNLESDRVKKEILLDLKLVFGVTRIIISSI